MLRRYRTNLITWAAEEPFLEQGGRIDIFQKYFFTRKNIFIFKLYLYMCNRKNLNASK